MGGITTVGGSIKKLIAFDLDDTLAVTKLPIEPEMASLLEALVKRYQICVITGGTYVQLQANLIATLNLPPELLTKFHLIALNGAHYYSFDGTNIEWKHERFIQDIPLLERKKIIAVLREAAMELGYWEASSHGEIIEDRGSQITFSALGQQAPPDKKYSWDPDRFKRTRLHERVSKELPNYEVNINGNTTIDVTAQGEDKGLGMERLLDMLSISKAEVLFIGDQLQETGNDYPIKAAGIECIAVNGWHETADIVQGILDGA